MSYDYKWNWKCVLIVRLNGVPLRRVSQAYVIATSTKVDISSVSIPESINDHYFSKSKAAKTTKEGEFFGEGKEKKTFPEEKKSEQKVSLKRRIIADDSPSTLPLSLPLKRSTTWRNT